MQKMYQPNLSDHYAVIGNPVQHSLSPLIHRLFAEQTGENLVYHALLAEQATLLQQIQHFHQQGGKGLNVTLPFKQAIYPWMNSCSERAKIAGMFNTITLHADGGLAGDNTDGIGLLRDLVFYHQFSLANKRILVIGAGGAARGILFYLLPEKPAELVIANRTYSKAAALVNEFSQWGELAAQPLPQLTGSFDLIIHASSAALHGESISLPCG